MTRTTSFHRAVAAIGVLGLALGSFLAVSTVTNGVAQASPSSADQAQQPRSLLFLSVAPRNGPITSAMLFCDPPGGLHPSPTAACADLAIAQGDFTKLPGLRERLVCADIYDPVVASAFGWWRNRLTWFTHTYPNACELYGATGPVFPVPNEQLPRPTTSTSYPMPTVTITTPPGPTRTTGTGPFPTMTLPDPTVTYTVPETTIPGTTHPDHNTP
jgi:hypothetical protein